MNMSQRRRGPSRSRRTGSVAGVLVAAVLGAGCAADATATDKAGGAGEPVTLRMANGYSSLDYEPAVAAFVNGVAETSDGRLVIEVVHEWGGLEPDFEETVLRDVAAGRVDLGWVATRSLDVVGVQSYRPLTAPMVIDGYRLQQAVIDSELSDDMANDLESIGVQELALLGGGMRRPFATEGPLLSPDDYSGLTFQTFRSVTQAAAIEALGADPTDKVFAELDSGLQDGSVDGFEKSIPIVQINGQQGLAPYVTTNVVLWPETALLIADPDRLAGLDEMQRDWLRTAAATAAAQSSALVDRDQDALGQLCRSGAVATAADPDDVAAMRAAVEPVIEEIHADSRSGDILDRILEIKQRTRPDGPLTIPSGCSSAPDESVPPSPDDVGVDLSGTYRWTLTEEDALTSGQPSDRTEDALAEYPYVFTVTMTDRTWRLDVRWASGSASEGGGTYSVNGDRLEFEWGAKTLGFTVVVQDNGDLELEPASPMEAGDVYVWTTEPWTRLPA